MNLIGPILQIHAERAFASFHRAEAGPASCELDHELFRAGLNVF
ncbi:hypothetical protein OCAR_6309 [Afipia carboxidovorans OM5]|nr:hypothetical protein OCAR_6309 [Afipia carboxidovorans OM5]